MSQHAEQTLLLLMDPSTGSKLCAQQALVSRDSAFDLPSLAVNPAVETSFHLPTVFSDGPLQGIALSGRDHRRSDPQLRSTKHMVVFGVVRRVGQEPIECDMGGGLSNDWRELRGILRRPEGGERPGQEMALPMAGDGELWKMKACVALLSSTPHVVAADVPGFQTCGIDDRFGLAADQPQPASRSKDGSLESVKGLFFTSRWAA